MFCAAGRLLRGGYRTDPRCRHEKWSVTSNTAQGSARTAMLPIADRCDGVMRTAHPSTAPTPQAVRINTRAGKHFHVSMLHVPFGP